MRREMILKIEPGSELAEDVDALFATGRYTTRESVVEAAVSDAHDRLMSESWSGEEIAELKASFAVTRAQRTRGEGIPAEQVFAELLAELEAEHPELAA